MTTTKFGDPLVPRVWLAIPCIAPAVISQEKLPRVPCHLLVQRWPPGTVELNLRFQYFSPSNNPVFGSFNSWGSNGTMEYQWFLRYWSWCFGENVPSGDDFPSASLQLGNVKNAMFDCQRATMVYDGLCVLYCIITTLNKSKPLPQQPLTPREIPFLHLMIALWVHLVRCSVGNENHWRNWSKFTKRNLGSGAPKPLKFADRGKNLNHGCQFIVV